MYQLFKFEEFTVELRSILGSNGLDWAGLGLAGLGWAGLGGAVRRVGVGLGRAGAGLSHGPRKGEPTKKRFDWVHI